MFLPKKRNTLQYHLVAAEPPFTVKMIDWVHHTGPRKHSILLSVTHTLLCLPSLSWCRSMCKRWKLFFVKPGVKVNGQY